MYLELTASLLQHLNLPRSCTDGHGSRTCEMSLSKYFGTHFRGLMGLKDHAAKPIKAQQHKKTRVHRSCWCCERIRDCTRYSDWKCMSNGKRFHTRLNGCDTFCSELTQCDDTLPVYGKVRPWERSSSNHCSNIGL